jgi:3-dehydroquinate synthase
MTPDADTRAPATGLTVELGERSYPIHIGSGLTAMPSPLSDHIGGEQALLVTNETLEPLYGDRVRRALAGHRLETVVLPDGEQHKTLDTTMRIYDALLAARFDRSCTLVALGGGVVGDITGFAAATYQRGVAFVQIPTTLLALVDSSVGGKTGVNHPRGKNMIGAFHQPRAVIADLDLLQTLPEREFRAGVAEVIKYGMINDPALFTWLEANLEPLMARDPAALAHVVEVSCRDKAAVVSADERESGQRALLNLGHTFGHALETATGYGELLHGEAVAVGLCMAAWMSAREGRIEAADFERVERLVARAGLPVRGPALTPDRFRELMGVDKKSLGGRLRLILLEGIGRAVVSADFDDRALAATLEHYATGPA